MTHPYVTQVKRELWEHRSLLISPLVAAAFFVLAAVVGALASSSTIEFQGRMRWGPNIDNPIMVGMASLASQVYLVSSITCFVYLLDCLYSERKDRSILFWKSLPVSDACTVLVKFAVGMVLVPLAVFVLVQVAFVLIHGILVLGVPAFAEVSANSGPGDWLEATLRLLGMLVATLLWYAPIGAWYMLASVSSRRAPILMATMPFVALGICESIFFHTKYVWQLLGYRLVPRPDLLQALTLPGMWLGLVAAAGMLYMVIRLRRYRDDT
jgi:ABC-2 type transport system permease protein